MQNLPPDIFNQIQKAMTRPEGTVAFAYFSPDLFDKEKEGGIIFEIPSGQHFFLLERDNDLNILFYHSSPGTGTRVATIDLSKITPSENVSIMCSWSPDAISFYISAMVPGAESASAAGVNSEKKFRIDKEGRVHQIGDRGLEVQGVNIYQDGQPILQPTAIEAWNETLKAIEILLTGESPEGYIYEVVTTNLMLVILVTGMEAYFKRRFLELEKEGIASNAEAVLKGFLPKKEQEAGAESLFQSEAEGAGKSLLSYMVSRGIINFQNYKQIKRAYNKAYGVKFGDLEFKNKTLEDIQLYIQYRHKIIHTSPLTTPLNQEKMPQENPAPSNRATGDRAKECFCHFVNKVHQATLSLRP